MPTDKKTNHPNNHASLPSFPGRVRSDDTSTTHESTDNHKPSIYGEYYSGGTYQTNHASVLETEASFITETTNAALEIHDKEKPFHYFSLGGGENRVWPIVLKCLEEHSSHFPIIFTNSDLEPEALKLFEKKLRNDRWEPLHQEGSPYPHAYFDNASHMLVMVKQVEKMPTKEDMTEACSIESTLWQHYLEKRNLAQEDNLKLSASLDDASDIHITSSPPSPISSQPNEIPITVLESWYGATQHTAASTTAQKKLLESYAEHISENGAIISSYPTQRRKMEEQIEFTALHGVDLYAKLEKAYQAQQLDSTGANTLLIEFKDAQQQKQICSKITSPNIQLSTEGTLAIMHFGPEDATLKERTHTTLKKLLNDESISIHTPDSYINSSIEQWFSHLDRIEQVFSEVNAKERSIDGIHSNPLLRSTDAPTATYIVGNNPDDTTRFRHILEVTFGQTVLIADTPSDKVLAIHLNPQFSELSEGELRTHFEDVMQRSFPGQYQLKTSRRFTEDPDLVLSTENSLSVLLGPLARTSKIENEGTPALQLDPNLITIDELQEIEKSASQVSHLFRKECYTPKNPRVSPEIRRAYAAVKAAFLVIPENADQTPEEAFKDAMSSEDKHTMTQKEFTHLLINPESYRLGLPTAASLLNVSCTDKLLSRRNPHFDPLSTNTLEELRSDRHIDGIARLGGVRYSPPSSGLSPFIPYLPISSPEAANIYNLPGLHEVGSVSHKPTSLVEYDRLIGNKFALQKAVNTTNKVEINSKRAQQIDSRFAKNYTVPEELQDYTVICVSKNPDAMEEALAKGRQKQLHGADLTYQEKQEQRANRSDTKGL